MWAGQQIDGTRRLPVATNGGMSRRDPRLLASDTRGESRDSVGMEQLQVADRSQREQLRPEGGPASRSSAFRRGLKIAAELQELGSTTGAAHLTADGDMVVEWPGWVIALLAHVPGPHPSPMDERGMRRVGVTFGHVHQRPWGFRLSPAASPLRSPANAPHTWIISANRDVPLRSEASTMIGRIGRASALREPRCHPSGSAEA